ncbi:glycosyl transferase family protein [Microseira wollei NIES-4236]|uniref:Glycosyl transferase family protein n=1 Tax=Microseira wollei NIES-4236 TaxID=2530354 RepID=A0AAV3WEV8_9CYAN|nr:glycosyl transferase family protein [Microseira wollei NIES-4236]
MFFGRSELERRRALKNLSLRVPFRPLVRFFYMYFGLKGFLDGSAGFTWCTLQAFYEYLIVLKVKELKHKSRINLAHTISDGKTQINLVVNYEKYRH